ncbi:MAG TPA: PAS domain-containing protein, partial [Polyangiaceae bacterium]|nr:PAS domain-containing protein [Polyangiaceae bacterium]
MAREITDSGLEAFCAVPGSEEILRAVLTTSSDYVVLLSRDARVVAFNRLPAGVTASGVIGASALEFVASEHRALLDATLREVAEHGEERQVEFTSGGKIDREPYRARIGPLFRQGELHGYVISSTELGALRGTEAELRENKDKLRIALAASQIGLWSWDAASNAIHWDAATKRIYARDTTPKSIEEYLALVHPDDRKLVKGHVMRTFERGEYPPLEYRIVRPNGEERWVLCQAEVIRDESGTITRLSGGLVDISERR